MDVLFKFFDLPSFFKYKINKNEVIIVISNRYFIGFACVRKMYWAHGAAWIARRPPEFSNGESLRQLSPIIGANLGFKSLWARHSPFPRLSLLIPLYRCARPLDKDQNDHDHHDNIRGDEEHRPVLASFLRFLLFLQFFPAFF